MEYVSTGPIASLLALVFFAGAIFACERAGRLLLVRAGLEPALSALESLTFSCGIGLTLLSLATLALGLAGFLSPFWATLFLTSTAAFSAVQLRRRGGSKRPALSEKPLFLALCAAMLVFSAAPAFTPPIANDALAYHLAHPKTFIESGRITPLAGTRESLWPFQTEMLFMLGLFLQGTTLAQLFHWVFYPLTAAAVYACADRFYGARAARFAAVAWLFTPLAAAQAPQAYNELALAFFVFCSYYVFMLKKELSSARAAGLSGIFCGAALGTKYLALIPAFVLAAYWLFQPFFLAACALVGGIWYLRSWFALGNPFYPFLSGLFGAGFESRLEQFAPMGKGIAALALHGWNVTMRPGLYGGEMIGPAYLIAAPFFADYWIGTRDKRFGKMMLFAALFCIAVFFKSQHVRYLAPALPFFCVGIGAVAAAGWSDAWRRWTLISAAVVICIAHVGIAAYRSRNAWPVIAGSTAAETYLQRHERSFEGHRYFKQNAVFGETVLVLGEPRQFYGRGPAQMLYWSQPMEEILKKRGVGLDDFIRERGFNYIWTRDDLSAELPGLLRSLGYVEVHSYEFRENADIFRHRIWRLGG